MALSSFIPFLASKHRERERKREASLFRLHCVFMSNDSLLILNWYCLYVTWYMASERFEQLICSWYSALPFDGKATRNCWLAPVSRSLWDTKKKKKKSPLNKQYHFARNELYSFLLTSFSLWRYCFLFHHTTIKQKQLANDTDELYVALCSTAKIISFRLDNNEPDQHLFRF